MANNTATVETLTAKVHVLQMGNRQITLSVAKQLDVVPLDQIEIFGRIRIGDKNEATGFNWVIGCDSNGTLVRSGYGRSELHVLRDSSVVLDLLGVPAGTIPVVDPGWAKGSYRDRHVEFTIDGIRCRIYEPHFQIAQHEVPEGIMFRGHVEELRRQAHEFFERDEQVRALLTSALEAPLIVLASR